MPAKNNNPNGVEQVRLEEQDLILPSQKRKQEEHILPSQRRKFFSPPAFGGEEANYKQAVEAAQGRIYRAERALQVQQGTARTMELLNRRYERQNARGDSASAEQTRKRMEELNRGWGDTQSAYTAAQAGVDLAMRRYNTAVERYNDYLADQQAQFEAWKGTIRDANTVQAELDLVNRQVRDLTARQELDRIGTLFGNALGAAGAASGGGVFTHGTAAVNPELERLKERQALLNEELEWSQYYRYQDLMAARDFAEKSRYATTANGQAPVRNALSGTYTQTGFDDLTYDYINRNQEAQGRALVNSIGDNTALLGLDTSYLAQMTDEEIGIFNYLYATQGADAAYAYTAYLSGDLNRRQRQEQADYWQKYAEEKPVEASAFSVLTSPLKGASYLGQVADYLADGKVDQNAAYNKFSTSGTDIRNQVSQVVQDKWGPVGSFAYQTGMSIADNLMRSAMLGGNQAMALTIMGTGAMADGVISAKNRGLSDDQAMILGTLNGIAEAAVERLNLDNALNPDALKDGMLQFMKKNALAEGGEELLTEFINGAFDLGIAGDQSQWSESAREYMSQGLDQKEALKKTFWDSLMQVSSAFFGGFISGGLMSGGAYITDTYQLERQNRGHDLMQAMEHDQLTFEDIINEGLSYGRGTMSYTHAERLKRKLDKGKMPSINELARLNEANRAARWEQAKTGGKAEENSNKSETTDDRNGQTEENPTLETDPDQMAADAARALRNGTITEEQFNQIMDEADHLREEQGGADNEEAERVAAGSYAGAGVSDEVEVGDAGAGTGEPAGGMAEGTGGARTQANRGAEAIVQRRNAANALWQQGLIKPVSSAELGVRNGTKDKAVLVYPQEHWDIEIQQLANRIQSEIRAVFEKDYNIQFVFGAIPFQGSDGRTYYARGHYNQNGMIVQLDDRYATPEQIADHEAFHEKSHTYHGKLLSHIAGRIKQQFSNEEFDRVMDTYMDEMWVLYCSEGASEAEQQMARQIIAEELLADAYAGINAFGAGADQFTDTVRGFMSESGIGRQVHESNGTEQPTGPPSGNRDRRFIADSQGQEDAPQGLSLPTLEDLDGGAQFSVDDSIHANSEEANRLYLDAVERGDMESAQRMVDQAAGEAFPDSVLRRNDGSLIKVYHGSPAQFNIFRDPGDMPGFYFSPWESFAKGYGTTRAFYLNLTNPVTYDEDWNATNDVAEEKADGFIYLPEDMEGGIDPDRAGDTEIVVFDAAQIKSADPVTYDDNGDPVPLSQRFRKDSPDIRFSFAGENARTADLDALNTAKQMLSEGVAAETVRQQTGWFKGMDGKWRWEIDDSGMHYDSSGDLRGAESARWAREDYQNAKDELWNGADEETLSKVRAFNRADLAGDDTAKQAIYEDIVAGPYSGLFREYVESMERAQQLRDAPSGGRLEDYIDHPALFEAYPLLHWIGLRFESMPAGKGGHYDSSRNEIVLNESLWDQEEEVLIHEIQHVIQEMEGFARGSSVSYWDRRQAGDGAVRKHDRTIREMRQKAEEILGSLPENVAEQFRRYSSMDDASSEAQMLVTELNNGPYEKEFNEYWFLQFALEDALRDNYKRGSRELYRNTAGEIEARNVSDRLRLSDDARRQTPPELGNRNTVFVEEWLDSLDADYGPQLQSFFEGDIPEEEVQAGIQTVAEMGSVASISGNEFDKGEKDLITQVSEFFDGLGNTAWNEQLGEVIMDRKGAKSDLGHGMGRKKAAAFAAVPAVIEQGRVVDYQKNWKERGHDTAVVAAPVTIGGQEYLAGVVLIRSNNTNRFYVHEVMTTESGASPFKTGARKGDPSGDAPSVFSILNRIMDVKRGAAGEQFSVGESMERGYVTHDERQYQARLQGYPVIMGEQIIPMKTWVQANDLIRDENGNSVTGWDGNPMRYNNYGLVTGRDGNDRLLVSFVDKNRIDPKTNDYVRRNNVSISIEDLTPVSGEYQMTRAEYDSLMRSAPIDPGTEELTAEQWAEIEELRQRAGGEMIADNTSTQEEHTPISKDALPRKAKQYVARVERTLLNEVGKILDVPWLAKREHLKGIVEQISEEYLQKGTVSSETIDSLFDTAYEQGRVIDSEFYDQYKHIKDHLRTTGVTLSKQDQADIADYTDFKKRAKNRVKILNEGGLPVDTAYQELNGMAPELFPERITHPADQLARMLEVSESIVKVKRKLDEQYADQAADFKIWAKNDFGAKIADAISELHKVARYMNDKSRTDTEEAEPKEKHETTQEEAAQMYQQFKDAKRAYERANARNLLTEQDQEQLAKLMQGQIQFEQLDPGKYNVAGIREVYQAKQAYEQMAKVVAQYRRERRSRHRAEADKFLETANTWKDKKVGLLYARETMWRNVLDIVEDQELAKKINRFFFEPVQIKQAEATRFMKEYRDRVNALNLSRKVEKGNLVSEAHAVQLLGEAQDNIRMLQNSRGRMKTRDGKTLEEWEAVVAELWKSSPKLDQKKINEAIVEFRKIYDVFFEMMNKARVAEGYEPVNYRKGYFPHFQPGDGDSILSQFGRVLGIDTSVETLPTTINGLTHTFRPGIQWFGNAQERLGFNTAYDAVEGFDKYIEGVAGVIFHTENIQRLRALSTQIRYRTSDEGIRKQVDAVNADSRLTEEEKQGKIKDIYENGRFTLSNFVNELDEYTNLLANKKSKFDRNAESDWGRRWYRIAKWLNSQVGANMIAGNFSSAMTNFIPLSQAWGRVGSGNILRGMRDTLRGVLKKTDSVTDMSDFLVNRRGSDPLVKTWSEKTSDKLGIPMELVDNFTSESIVRAAYYQNLSRGLSEAEAMHQADLFAAGVMGDRSKGAMPTVFHRTSFIPKLFTQFQLEVNNQFSEIFKDIPREYKDKAIWQMFMCFLTYFLGAFLMNELEEKVKGRRSALDPIGMAVQFGEDWKRIGFTDAAGNLMVNAASSLPFFSPPMAFFGVDGGRVPIQSAIPDIKKLGNALTNGEWSAKRRWTTFLAEMSKPVTYLASPFGGGGQISKTLKGWAAFAQGGVYGIEDVEYEDEETGETYVKGEPYLKYPVIKGEGDDFWDIVRLTLLGTSALDEAQEWVANDFNSMSAKQTAVYLALKDAGAEDQVAYDLVRAIQGAEKTDSQSETGVKRDLLREADIPGDGKAAVYYSMILGSTSVAERALMNALDEAGADMGAVTDVLMDIHDAVKEEGSTVTAAQRAVLRNAGLDGEFKAMIYYGKILNENSSSERALMDQLAKGGADMGAVTDVLMAIHDADALSGAEASNARRDAIANSALTDAQKLEIYRAKISTARDEEIQEFKDAGMDFDEFLKVQNQYSIINEKQLNSTQKAIELSYWADNQPYSDEQRETIKEAFKFYGQMPADADRYDKLVDSGLSKDDAFDLSIELGMLEPEEGKTQVADVQKWREAIDFSSNEAIQYSSLAGIMEEKQFPKFEAAYEFGVTPDAYVTYHEIKKQYDADGNGDYTQAEVTAAINAMGKGMTKEQKAALWQIVTGTKSAKNNPYSVSVGQKVLEYMGKG